MAGETRDRADSVTTTSSDGNVQLDLDRLTRDLALMGNSVTYLLGQFTTPEQFGAVGDGVADDTDFIQQAADVGVTLLFRGSSTYRVTRPIILPYTAGIQTIDGRGATIKWEPKDQTVFNQRDALGAVGNRVNNKFIQNLIIQGTVGVSSAWSESSSCVGVRYSNSTIYNVKGYGLTNLLMSYENGYAYACHGHNLRNALWSCYIANNHLYFSSFGWTAGEGMVCKGDSWYVHEVHGDKAGCLPADSADGPLAARGVLLSSGADGSPSSNGYFSNISCNQFGGGGLNLQGVNINGSGTIRCGDIYEDNYQPSIANQQGCYYSCSHSRVTGVSFGTTHKGVVITGRAQHSRFGVVSIEAKKNVAGAQLLTAGDTTTPEGVVAMVNTVFEGLNFGGQLTLNDDIYVNSDGLTCGPVRVRALNNQQGGTSVNINKSPILTGWVLEATNSASVNNIVRFSGDAVVNDMTIRRVYGTAVTVTPLSNPKLNGLYIMEKQGTAAPIILQGTTGNESRALGVVRISGQSVARPTVVGVVSALAYAGPAWRKGAAELQGITRMPVMTETTLTD